MNESHKTEQCPRCGKPLAIIRYGLYPKEVWDELEKEPVRVIEGGCMLQRAAYFCDECQLNFNGDLQPLKDCLFTADQITEDECRNHDLLITEAGGELPENKEYLCNTICPLQNGQTRRFLKKDGTVLEAEITGISIDEKKFHIKFKRDEHDFYHYDTVGFSEICSIDGEQIY